MHHVCMVKEEAQHVNMYSICFAHRVCMYMYVLCCENWTKWPFMSFFVFSLPPINMSSTIYTYVCMYIYMHLLLNVLCLPAYSDILDDQVLCFYKSIVYVRTNVHICTVYIWSAREFELLQRDIFFVLFNRRVGLRL